MNNHIPMRRCIGCGESKDKALLTRYVSVDGIAVKDESANLPGRGVYICTGSEKCLKTAIERHAFERMLKAKYER